MIIFDLDGTLALNEHRQHFINCESSRLRDWKSFNEACYNDKPNWPIINTLLMFYNNGKDVRIWSGRTMDVERKTKTWLLNSSLGKIPLKMRPSGDYQTDVALKQSWLDAEPIKPALVFDDRNRIVKMWRDNGIVCCQVAEGNF